MFSCFGREPPPSAQKPGAVPGRPARALRPGRRGALRRRPGRLRETPVASRAGRVPRPKAQRPATQRPGPERDPRAAKAAKGPFSPVFWLLWTLFLSFLLFAAEFPLKSFHPAQASAFWRCCFQTFHGHEHPKQGAEAVNDFHTSVLPLVPPSPCPLRARLWIFGYCQQRVSCLESSTQ